MNNKTEAEVRIASSDVRQDLPFFTDTLGFRLEKIFPADDPSVAVLSGHGVRLRIEKGAMEPPGTLRILTEDPATFAAGKTELTAPNGMRIEIAQLRPPLQIPVTEHAFLVRRLQDQAPWVIGRAGMQYRDLIPSRLGGSIIASHIRIPDGGPVPDMVHYHTIGFQLIYCYKGWVDLVYEDQGPEFRLHAGDCVIQPPEIRHRVLYASDNIEVIEIGVPAEHITTIDHEMELPNDTINRDRKFQGQNFVHHKQAEANRAPFRIPGFTHRDTGINTGTNGLASVQVTKFESGIPPTTSHGGDILFTFVMEGSMTLRGAGQPAVELSPGDAFVIPPKMATRYSDCSADLELLEVALPGQFETTIEPSSD
ncbi:MAG TPA: cupin [Planctomycetaceae bacterium]|nr:cupin [Planctomycetaceae bacterium]